MKTQGTHKILGACAGLLLLAVINQPAHAATTWWDSLYHVHPSDQYLIDKPDLGMLMWIASSQPTIRGLFVVVAFQDSTLQPPGTKFCYGANLVFYSPYRQFARTYNFGFAIMLIPKFFSTPSMALHQSVFDSIAQMSGHPEVRTVPLFLIGEGQPQCRYMCYLMSNWTTRTMGAILNNPNLDSWNAGLAYVSDRSIPIQVGVGNHDNAQGTHDGLELARRARANKLACSFACARNGTYGLMGYATAMNKDFFTQTLALRLPPEQTTLQSINQQNGWLGTIVSTTQDTVVPQWASIKQPTFWVNEVAISPYSSFAGNPDTAFWLPSEAYARAWPGYQSASVQVAVAPASSAQGRAVSVRKPRALLVDLKSVRGVVVSGRNGRHTIAGKSIR